MCKPLTDWQMTIDRYGRALVTGQVLGSRGMAVIHAYGLDPSSQIIETPEYTRFYLMTGSDNETREYSSLVSALLRGIVKRIDVDESSPYHNAGKVDLNRDVWWLICGYLDHESRSALARTGTWYRMNIPMFIDKADRDGVISTLISGGGDPARCVVPISSLHNAITADDAVMILDNIFHGEFSAVPPFVALLLMKSGNCMPKALKTVPHRYLSSLDFAKSFIRYSLTYSWGKPSNILCDILKATAVGESGWMWVHVITGHRHWDWYSPQYKRILSSILIRDDPTVTHWLIPRNLSSLMGDIVDAILLHKSFRTAAMLIGSDKLTSYYPGNPEWTFTTLKKVAVWLCRMWRMNDLTMTKLYHSWNSVLGREDKKKLYQSLRDVLATRKGCTRGFLEILSSFELGS